MSKDSHFVTIGIVIILLAALFYWYNESRRPCLRPPPHDVHILPICDDNGLPPGSVPSPPFNPLPPSTIPVEQPVEPFIVYPQNYELLPDGYNDPYLSSYYYPWRGGGHYYHGRPHGHVGHAGHAGHTGHRR